MDCKDGKKSQAKSASRCYAQMVFTFWTTLVYANSRAKVKRETGNSLKINNKFTFSNGWLGHFRKHAVLSYRTISRESTIVN
jgi:hypothetical protein